MDAVEVVELAAADGAGVVLTEVDEEEERVVPAPAAPGPATGSVRMLAVATQILRGETRVTSAKHPRVAAVVVVDSAVVEDVVAAEVLAVAEAAATEEEETDMEAVVVVVDSAVAEAGDPCEAAVVGAVAVIVGTGRTKQKTVIHLYGHKLTVYRYVNNEHHPRSITLKQFC